jgi:hypothetical protein
MKGAAFAAATFLGAFLLFQVQPLIGKFILPWFGGATSVWTTCMLFFQIVLLAGYAYAHALTRIKRPHVQLIVHLVVVAAAVVFLPIHPSEQWKPTGATDPTWRILGLLLACLGAPYFVLSATSPLLQAWFYRALPDASPYRLYALSNVGSLLALISFPFMFEPLFARRALSTMWSGGFVAFAITLVCCALAVWRVPPDTAPEEAAPVADRSHWLLWILLPAAGSVMLLATTNKICQDIAVVPFLWVVPLALYLLSFIISFDNPRWYRRVPYLITLIALSAAVCVVMFNAPNPPLLLQIAAFCCLLFVYCMVCHGEVYRLKPHPSRLTAFYLCIAFGGALGGIFVGLIAPLIFNNYLEFHLGMILGPLLLAIILYREGRQIQWKLTATATVMLALALTEHVSKLNRDVVARTRNFYGVLRVLEYNPRTPRAHFKRMLSGDIAHGEQFVQYEQAMLPTTYFVEPSGVGRALRSIPPGERRTGTIGLGVGTLAAYAHAGDTFRFYEINPESKRFAERHFTYLIRATGNVEVVLGDARLSMEREPPQNYDLLVLDAFSGDSIPVHLLTREAFAVYLRHVKTNGAIAVHITNRHLELAPVVQKLAEHYRLRWAHIPYNSGEMAWHYASVWMLLSRDSALLEQELIRTDATTPKMRNVRLWTDDYASLLPLLKYETR